MKEVFVLIFGWYGRAPYLNVHLGLFTKLVRAFKRYLFFMKDIFHVSSNIYKLWLLLCWLRVPFQVASPPGFHVAHIPKGNLAYIIVLIKKIEQRQQWVRPIGWNSTLQPAWYITHVRWCAGVASFFGRSLFFWRVIAHRPQTSYLSTINSINNRDRHWVYCYDVG